MLDNVKLRVPADGDAPPVRNERAAANPYVYIVDEFGPSIAATFKLLAVDGALPAVFHCMSGKDRTGIVTALMLDLLGVPEARDRGRLRPYRGDQGPEFQLDRGERTRAGGLLRPDTT